MPQTLFDWKKLVRQDMAEKVVIYTDGSSRGNPGPGGYGIVMMFGKMKKEFAAGYRLTTNNRMELLAVITALGKINHNKFPIEIYTDSKYVVDSVSKGWLDKWIATDFKGGKKNKDLWIRYYRISKGFRPTFHWVKGHAQHIHNNRCDELATTAADGVNLLIDEGYESGEKNLF